MALIRAEDLRKVYTRARNYQGRWGWLRSLGSRQVVTKVAVDGVTFSIDAGELVGYIGPNGAGKSTTIKMLTGVLVPTSGLVEVRGLVPYRQRVRTVRRLGVVFGQRTQLWWDLPTIESFRLLRYVYGVPESRYRENLARFTALLDLGPFLDTPVRQLSLGQRMRADLAAAFMHDPDLVFLDEPTIGLDLVAKDHIRQFIKEVNLERGVTVVLTTHDMSDIESLCDRIMIIDSGRIILDGSIDNLRARFGCHRRLVIDFEEAPAALDGVPAEVVSQSGRRVELRFRRDCVSAAQVIAAAGRHGAIRDLAIHETSIEDIVRRVYQNGLGGS